MSYMSLKLTMSKTKSPQDMFLLLGSVSWHIVPSQKVGAALNISLPQYAAHLFFLVNLPPAISHSVFFLLLLSQAPLSAASPMLLGLLAFSASRKQILLQDRFLLSVFLGPSSITGGCPTVAYKDLNDFYQLLQPRLLIFSSPSSSSPSSSAGLTLGHTLLPRPLCTPDPSASGIFSTTGYLLVNQQICDHLSDPSWVPWAMNSVE